MREQFAPLVVRFLCLARNCEKTIPTFVDYLGHLEAIDIQPFAIIGENGSTDRTRVLLDEAASERFQVLDTAFMSSVPGRLRRMAAGRQALLEAARAQEGTEEFVCVADLDNVMSAPPSPQSVKAAFEYLRAERTLFAVGATSEPVYYDLLSLQADGHDYRTLHTEIADAKRRPASYFRFHKHRIYANQRRATTGSPILCKSSFNGFCLYKAADYYLGTYRSPDEGTVCEHVTFNVFLHQSTGKSMMILPGLKINTPADHGPVSFWRFWADRVSKLA